MLKNHDLLPCLLTEKSDNYAFWKICTRMKESCPNGVRLENLTWRLMHLCLNKERAKEQPTPGVLGDIAGWDHEFRNIAPTGKLSQLALVESTLASRTLVRTVSPLTATPLQPSAQLPACNLAADATLVPPTRPRSTRTARSRPKKPQTKRENVCCNCKSSITSLWRRHTNGEIICNACACYFKLRGVHRPLDMRTEVVLKRNRQNPKSKKARKRLLSKPAHVPAALPEASTRARKRKWSFDTPDTCMPSEPMNTEPKSSCNLYPDDKTTLASSRHLHEPVLAAAALLSDPLHGPTPIHRYHHRSALSPSTPPPHCNGAVLFAPHGTPEKVTAPPDPVFPCPGETNLLFADVAPCWDEAWWLKSTQHHNTLFQYFASN